VAGAAGLGALRALVTHADATALRAPLERLRATVAEVGGGVIIERGPRALRERIDPWARCAAGAGRDARDQTEFDPAPSSTPAASSRALTVDKT